VVGRAVELGRIKIENGRRETRIISS